MSNTIFGRLKDKAFAARISLSASAFEYNVGSNHDLFKSEHKGASTNYSATKGSGSGIRHNVRIKPESNPIWVQYNSTDNDKIYIAGDEVLEEYNVKISNLFITPASETTAQIDQWIAAAESSGNYEAADGSGEYFKLYAIDPDTGLETVHGIWFDTDGGSSEPTDSEVDTWHEVDVTSADSANTIAAATEVVVDAITGVFTSADTTPGTLDITHSESGSRRNAAASAGLPGTLSTDTEGAGTATLVNIKVS